MYFDNDNDVFKGITAFVQNRKQQNILYKRILSESTKKRKHFYHFFVHHGCFHFITRDDLHFVDVM